jgi:hypothetical protein
MSDKLSDEKRAFQEGALVVLTIGGKTWQTTVSPHDYGLERFPATHKPSHKLLLPEDAIHKIAYEEGYARRALDKFSFNFGLSNVRVKHRWVHMDKLGLVLATLDECKEAFFKAVDELIEKYDEHKETMRLQVAKEYQELKTVLNNPNLTDPWPGMQRLYPGKPEIRPVYYFEYTMINMTFPTGMSAIKRYELQQADLALLNRKKAEEMTQEELRRKEAEHRERLNRIMVEQQQIAVRRAEEFVEGVVVQLRGKVVEVFQNITERIREGKTIAKTNLESIRSALEEVRQLDFLGSDQDFHTQLNRVSTLIDSGRQFSSDSQATRELDAALNQTVDFINRTNDQALEQAKKMYFGRKINI